MPQHPTSPRAINEQMAVYRLLARVYGRPGQRSENEMVTRAIYVMAEVDHYLSTGTAPDNPTMGRIDGVDPMPTMFGHLVHIAGTMTALAERLLAERDTLEDEATTVTAVDGPNCLLHGHPTLAPRNEICTRCVTDWA